MWQFQVRGGFISFSVGSCLLPPPMATPLTLVRVAVLNSTTDTSDYRGMLQTLPCVGGVRAVERRCDEASSTLTPRTTSRSASHILPFEHVLEQGEDMVRSAGREALPCGTLLSSQPSAVVLCSVA